ncbi:hypothetical protein D9V42_14900, partial [Staphylococcus pseudoxylosus]
RFLCWFFIFFIIFSYDVIQEILGHKTMSITEQVYSHVTENMNHKAKKDFEKFIQEKEIF